MELRYRDSESTEKPAVVEMGKTSVFIRKNIIKVVVTDNDQSVTYWRYQEAVLTHDEFNNYSKLMFAENADSIRQILNGQTDGNTNQLILMEAIADLYDVVASLM